MVVGIAAFVFGATHPMTYLTLVSSLDGRGLSSGVTARASRTDATASAGSAVHVRPAAEHARGLLLVALIAIENIAIWMTPNLPHHTQLMREIGLGLFYGHLALLTILPHRDLAAICAQDMRDFLMETSWKAAPETATQYQPRVAACIFHRTADPYHAAAPWYFAITHFQYSVLLLPLTIPLGIFIHSRFLKVVNQWFYRDHWLAHHSEFEFIYLHGPHQVTRFPAG